MCGEPGAELKCGQCKARRYCGAACQRIDWVEGGHRLQCVPVSEDGRNKIFVVVTMRGEGQLKVFDNRKLAEACALKENGDVRYTFWSETPAMHR